MQIFNKEFYVWYKLRHPNVLPLLGFSTSEQGYPQFISEWMNHGSLDLYIKNNPELGLKASLILVSPKGSVSYLTVTPLGLWHRAWAFISA